MPKGITNIIVTNIYSVYIASIISDSNIVYTLCNINTYHGYRNIQRTVASHQRKFRRRLKINFKD